MQPHHRHLVIIAAAASLSAASAFAQPSHMNAGHGDSSHQSTNTMGSAAAPQGDQGDIHQVRGELKEAAQVARHIQKDSHADQLLQQAKGVFILPDYGRGALGVGGQGGQGVLVMRKNGAFTDPVFYNLAGVSLGFQAGGSAGQVAMFLMTDKAVQAFRSHKNLSLDADAGLTIGTYSARSQASGGKVNDIVVWSNAKGLYAGASVGITDVTYDAQANNLYYGQKDTDPSAIVGGQLQPRYPDPLKKALG